MIPPPGETAGDWWANTGFEKARLAAAIEHGYPSAFDLATYFLHDVPAETVAAAEGHNRPEADIVFGQSCDFSHWPNVRTLVVAGRDDRFFPVEFQRQVARQRFDIAIDVIPGGHLLALANPSGLADYLDGHTETSG
jgi:pimeloyl-ACP methyl ester carboxylesterase